MRHSHVLLKGTKNMTSIEGSLSTICPKTYIDIHPQTLTYLDAQVVPDLLRTQTCPWVFLICLHHFQSTILLSVRRYSNYFTSSLFQAQSKAFSQGDLAPPLRSCSEIIPPTIQKYLHRRSFVAALFVIIKYWKLSKWANIREMLENCSSVKRNKNISVE